MADDTGPLGPDDAGMGEPCPDFSCEARCAAVSVCSCVAPGGEAECAGRGGACVGDRCIASDAGPPDAGAATGDEGDAGGGAVDAGPTDPDGGGAAGPGEVGVPCGALTCEAGVAFCAACDGDPAVGDEARCVPYATEGWVFSSATCGFPGVFVQCDGAEDCGADEVCVFMGGEWGYGQCVDAGDAFGRLACHDDADCGAGEGCGEVDPLGYFSPLYDRLGWRPRACGGASAEATEFCDRYDAACGIGFGEELTTRDECLNHFDGHDADGRACLFTLLTEAEAGSDSHCVYAANPGPCS